MTVLLYIVIFFTICNGWTPLSVSNDTGERWAVLVAGTMGWEKYRHQANVCHAYQILRKGGLKKENIIVFMYDDIAYNLHNGKPGKIYNELKGNDVYQGVPKDYTGEYVTTLNFYNALLGYENETIGNKKVLHSGPNDNVFIYFTSAGTKNKIVLDMQHNTAGVNRDDFLKILTQMHSKALYKQMVVYVDASRSGSMFNDIEELDDMNIFVTTATDWYQDNINRFYVHKWHVYLSTKYSAAWMKDCEIHNLSKTTFNQQYARVKEKVAEDKYWSSDVMKYGSERVGEQYISEFFQKS